jgi:hypothetical protein
VSVFDIYDPESFDVTSFDRGQEYIFTFSFLENSSIEVYEIITVSGTDLRYLVPVTDYILYPNITDSRYPVARGGRVVFSRRHSEGTTRVVVERNTLIDQTVDFPDNRYFNPRQLEIACDKHTMIAQELAVRKCLADTGELDMAQKVTITQYDDYKGSVIQFMLDKITAILLAIDTTAEDCRTRPEET